MINYFALIGWILFAFKVFVLAVDFLEIIAENTYNGEDMSTKALINIIIKVIAICWVYAAIVRQS